MSAPDRQQQVPVSLGKPSLRLRLEAYYSLVAPDTIADQVAWRSRFDQIYAKFGGSHDKERRLAKKLAKKYGTTVKLLLAESAIVAKRGVASLPDTAVKRDEEWYRLRENEKGSGIINFTSNTFDPVAALTAPETAISRANPWLPAGPMHDHIDQCRTLLPSCDPMRRLPVSTRKRDRSEKTPGADIATKRPKIPSPFATLAEDHEKGPLSLLYTALVKRQRVRVMIRYIDGIRGTLTGFLLAFDKHFNMLLRDTDEVYSPRLASTELSNVERELTRRQSALTTSHEKTRQQGQWSVRQKHMKQMLVRGDNVVMVYKAESERSAWPRTSKSPPESIYQNVSMDNTPREKRVGTPGSLIYAHQRSHRQTQRRGRF